MHDWELLFIALLLPSSACMLSFGAGLSVGHLTYSIAQVEQYFQLHARVVLNHFPFAKWYPCMRWLPRKPKERARKEEERRRSCRGPYASPAIEVHTPHMRMRAMSPCCGRAELSKSSCAQSFSDAGRPACLPPHFVVSCSCVPPSPWAQPPAMNAGAKSHSLTSRFTVRDPAERCLGFAPWIYGSPFVICRSVCCFLDTMIALGIFNGDP